MLAVSLNYLPLTSRAHHFLRRPMVRVKYPRFRHRGHPPPSEHPPTTKPVNYRREEKKILDRILNKQVYDTRMRPRGVNSTGKQWLPVSNSARGSYV